MFARDRSSALQAEKYCCLTAIGRLEVLASPCQIAKSNLLLLDINGRTVAQGSQHYPDLCVKGQVQAGALLQALP